MLRLTSRRSMSWCVRRLSTNTQPDPQEKPKPPPKQFNIYHSEIRMDDLLARESPLLVKSQGKVERPPFVKNLFRKAIDHRFLTYPEVLEPPEVSIIADLYNKIKEYVDSLEPLSLKYATPNEVMDTLRDFGVFGVVAPEEYGGLGLSVTEHCKIIEAFAKQPSLAVRVIAHSSSGIQPMLMFATRKQKADYLPKLASGEWISALAMHEPESGTDTSAVKTTLKLTPDESYYTLNGTKTYVTNGQDANLFTVICNVDLIGSSGSAKTSVSAALVQRDLPGVKVEKCTRLLGLNGAGLATVTFDNVKLPLDCLLGNQGEGFELMKAIQSDVRCLMTAAAVGTAREAVNLTITNAIKTHRYERPLHEFQMIGQQVINMTGDVYAMESAIYMTAAIADVVQDPDHSLEAAAARLFCTQAARRVLESSIDVHGVKALAEDHDLVRWHNDLRTLDVFESTPNMCRLLITMSGLQHAGIQLASKIQVLRDPMAFPIRFTKIVLGRFGSHPKSTRELEQFIHPSLRAESDKLEICMMKLGLAAENALEQWGAEVYEHQTILNRLSEISVDVYVLATVLARASRSYCIGLPNADYDVKLCQIFTTQVCDRVDVNVDHIKYAITAINQWNLVETSMKIFSDKKYIAAHPLTRNWE